ncbi:Hypoxia up-regulated protein 1 [Borealophlyctis nickersoniae]|nr:Hypoxia up-regulated protein 1 [Borealophlyctis nickersoniae]
MPRAQSCLLWASLLALLLFLTSASASVLGIDYGTDWFKVSIVKPGVPNEIVLNRESKRKTTSVVLIREGVRHFGSDAVALGTRFPHDTYPSLKNLLGKLYDDPHAAEYRATFQNTMVKDPKRGTIAFRHDENTMYTVEELVAFQLAHAKQQATVYGEGEAVTGAVITVPPYWNQFERKALLDAADLAGLRIFQLMNDETAVALNYAMSRTFPKPEHHVFYDMGAGSTVASLVKFETKTMKEGRLNKTMTQLEVKAVGYDATLGGQSVDLKIQQLLAQNFMQETGKKLGVDIFSDARAMAKLLKEANRVKQILSANQETFASVEGLLPEVDFKMKLTRSMLEEISKDVIDRVPGPVSDILKSANLREDEIDSIVLVGGGVRVPAVQTKLRELVGEDKIAQNVNGDEAAVLGAGWEAAKISKQFRIGKDIRIKDINEHPVEFVYDAEPSGSSKTRTFRTTLLTQQTALGAKKLVNFKRTTDFAFDLAYKEGNKATIVHTTVSGLAKAFETYPNATDSKVKVTIDLDESGLISVGEGYAVFEITRQEKPSLKDTVLNFFGAGKKEGDVEKEEQTAGAEADSKEGESNSTQTVSNNTQGVAPANSTAGVKKVTEKVNLNMNVQWRTVVPLDEETKLQMKKRIGDMDAEDQQRRLREEALNTLEGFVYRTKEFLYDEEVEKVSLEDERVKLKEQLDEAGDWLYDEGANANVEDLNQRLDKLHSLYTPILKRRDEMRERPPAIAALRTVLAEAKKVLRQARYNVTADVAPGEKPIYSENELSAVESSLNTTEKWLQEKLAAQDKLELHSEPAVLVHEINTKARAAEIEATMLTMKYQRRMLERKKRAASAAKQSKTESAGDSTVSASQMTATETPSEGEHEKRTGDGVPPVVETESAGKGGEDGKVERDEL